MGKLHPTRIGDMKPEEIGRALAGLRYDCLTAALLSLADKLERDAVADYGRKRPKLADRLVTASGPVALAARIIEDAWIIASKHEGRG